MEVNRFNKLNRFSLTIFISFLAVFLMLFASFASASFAAKTENLRLAHAQEILGKNYSKSIIKKTAQVKDVSEFVKAATKRFLPKAYRKNAAEIAKTILAESETYQFDPLFLMAMIQNESSFNPKTKAPQGEIGLMQIKPSIAEWVSELYHLPYYGKTTLLDPVQNIRIGAAFLDKLRKQFKDRTATKDRGQLYVSAYNMGPRNVRNLVAAKVLPKIYLNAVSKRYLAFYSALTQKGNSKAKGEIAWVKLNRIASLPSVF